MVWRNIARPAVYDLLAFDDAGGSLTGDNRTCQPTTNKNG
jgi:hypothetical protein